MTHRISAILATCSVLAAACLMGCTGQDYQCATTVLANEATAVPVGKSAPVLADKSAESLLRGFFDNDNRKELTSRLRPKKEDCQAVFIDDVADSVYQQYKPLWELEPPSIGPSSAGQTELLVWSATTEELQQWTGDAERHFPGGWKEIAWALKPGLTFYRFKFVEPGETLGMAYDGLVFVNEHWAWIPKPWRVVPSRKKTRITPAASTGIRPPLRETVTNAMQSSEDAVLVRSSTRSFKEKHLRFLAYGMALMIRRYAVTVESKGEAAAAPMRNVIVNTARRLDIDLPPFPADGLKLTTTPRYTDAVFQLVKSKHDKYVWSAFKVSSIANDLMMIIALDADHKLVRNATVYLRLLCNEQGVPETYWMSSTDVILDPEKDRESRFRAWGTLDRKLTDYYALGCVTKKPSNGGHASR